MKERLESLGDNTFNIIYLILSFALAYLAFAYEISFLQIISIALVKVGIFTMTGTWFIRFLNGLKCNIYQKIFEENNIASSIFVAGMLIGLAIVIAVAI
jgi:hypothetical protein